jgi:hypothetical protein
MFTPDDIMEVMADEIGDVQFDQYRSSVNEDSSSVQRRNVYHRRYYARPERFWPEQETYPNYRGKTTGGLI